MLDGSGVQITSGEELAEIIRARRPSAGCPVAVHAIGDRREPRRARRVRGDARRVAPLGLRQRIEHAQLLAPEDLPRFAALGVAASVQFSHAPSDRDLADRLWAGKTDGAYAYRSLRRLGRGRRERLRRADRGARPARGHPRRRAAHDRRRAPAWHPEQALTVQQAFEATTVAPGVADRRGAPPRQAAARASPPTWSCSTAIRGTTSTRRSWRRWSPAGGCTTRRPGTERRSRTAARPAVAGRHVGRPNGRVRVASAACSDPHPVGLDPPPSGGTLPPSSPSLRQPRTFVHSRPLPGRVPAVSRNGARCTFAHRPRRLARRRQSAASARKSSAAAAIPSGT